MGNGVTVPTSLWTMSRWMVIVMVVAEGFVPKYKVQYLYPSNCVIHEGSWFQQGHGHGHGHVRVRVQVSNEEGGGGGKERDTTSRPRRMPRDDRRRRSRPSTPSLPEAEPRRIRRAPHQFDHTQEEARPLLMDPVSVVRSQPDNEDAPAYDLSLSSTVWTTEVAGTDGPPPRSHWETRSLNDLFPGRLDGLSELFASSHEFRTALRAAIREDVFDTTPAYANLSAKARSVLLLPDSSLQGSWKCRGGRWQRHQHPSNDDNNNNDNNNDHDHNNQDGDGLRMVRLTRVLREALGPEAPNGDEFMDTIGSLCSFTVYDDDDESNGNDDDDDDGIDEDPSSTHWIDIVGVSKRRVPHSWHQDTGRAGASLSTEGSRRRRQRQRRTVLWGFPAENDYDGVGVFSHVVKLARERWAHEDHPLEKPVVYTPTATATSTSTSTTMDDRYIVRPRFAPGRELLLFRDVDVLHSAPDVIYRTSLMRFM